MRRNYVLMLLLLFFIGSNIVLAQEKTISGTVTDSFDGEPISGVSVLSEDGANTAITDELGNYQIEVSENATLIFSNTGYVSQEIQLGETNVVNVQLVSDMNVLEESDTQMLEGVVITALGITREEKALGYSVAQISTDQLNQAANTQVANAIQGKAAGVQVNTTGNGVGGSSKITIRGNSSLGGSNEPLWIVDGVPFNDSQMDRAGADQTDEWGGIDRAGASFDLNPEDIESITVLKGASAAALYGSRAGNGVILVTTKKGSRSSRKLGINFNTSTVFSQVAYMQDLQNRYGQGAGGEYDKNGASSWGPAMNGQMLESWTGEIIPYTAQPDKRKDFFRTGVTQAYNISVAGGGEKTTARLSFGYNNSTDVIPEAGLEKYNYDLRLTHELTDWIHLDSKIAYIYTNGKNRPEAGNYGFMNYFDRMPANIRTQDLEPGYVIEPGSGNHLEQIYTGNPDANNRNPYFINAQRRNEDNRFRTFGYISSTFDLTNKLSLRTKYALDYYREKIEKTYLYHDNVYQNTPSYELGENFFKESNLEFLFTYKTNLGESFDMEANVGGNLMQTYNENLTSNSGKINGEGDYYIGAGTNITSSNFYSEKEIQSIYGLLSFGFKNFLFADITARNDWSSTLPSNYNSYFYPSVNLSFVVSDAFNLKGDGLNLLKLRGSWAKVGKDTDPYRLYSTYSISQGNFGNVYAGVDIIKRLATLKPEISEAFEFGLDAGFFKNRIGLDATYYNSDTKNQVLPVDIAQSSQYTQAIINAGLIRNEGIEILLTTEPIRTENFKLGLDFNFAKNTTTVVELTEGVERYKLGELNNGLAVVADEGELFGDIIGRTYLRDDSGNIILDDQGLPSIGSDQEVLGNIQPDFTGSIGLSLDFKGVFLRSLFTMQQGGEVYSFSEAQAVGAGTALRTIDRDRFDGTGILPQAYYSRISGAAEEFIYDASFMKLGEISVGYNFKSDMLNRFYIQSASISLVGRNLFYVYKDTPGTAPDAGAYNRSVFTSALDYATVPNTRSYGVQLNLSF